MTDLYSDIPIAGAAFDALGRAAVANRLLELATSSVDTPLVIGLFGAAGDGKTSVLRMTGELCGARPELLAFSIDAWIAGSAAGVNDAFVREVADIFDQQRVLGGAERVRERLFAVGDVVSAVARFAGAKVDVKGALERSPDEQRDEVLKHTEAIGKRIVVFLDHVDRLPPIEATAVIKAVSRWGMFPYFAFVVAADRALLAHKLRRIEGTADDIERVFDVELPLPVADRAALAATVRGGLTDLAQRLRIDPGPALALFDVETGVGLAAIATPRAAKHLLNAVIATFPLAGTTLRAVCLVEVVRMLVPDAITTITTRLPLVADATGRARLAADLAPYATRHRRSDVATALFAALLA